ncbi:MAG: LamG domain-containing protein [Kofleriaceae bacterium]
MHRLGPALLVMTACSFPGSGGSGGSDGAPPVLDAPLVIPDAELPVEDAPDAAPADVCGDPDLLLCLEFEDDLTDGTTTDGAGARELVATDVTGTPRASGGGTERAVLLGPTSVIYAAAEPAFQRDGNFTIELWVRADEQPAGERSVVVDHNGNYALILAPLMGPFMRLRCAMSGTINGAIPIPLGAWTHVACVFGVDEIRAYVGGLLAGVTGRGPDQDGNSDLVIGQDAPLAGGDNDRLRGALDDVKLWTRALSPEELTEIIDHDVP